MVNCSFQMIGMEMKKKFLAKNDFHESNELENFLWQRVCSRYGYAGAVHAPLSISRSFIRE
jgi:hypothetical protein